MATNRNGFSRRRRARANFRAHGPLGAQKISRVMGVAVVLLAVGLVGIMAVGGAGLVYYQSLADELVAPDELAINQPSYGAKIYDRNGKILYEYVDDRSGLRRPVEITDISPALLAATIATEDDSFFSNPGVNIRGLARAVWENTPLSGTGSVFEGSGGSSITQQLVKNVYIGQETVADVTIIDDQIRDLKTELQAIPAPLPDIDPERQTADLRVVLEQQQASKPSPLTANQLEVLSRLETKISERETLEGLVQGERQSRSVERKAKEIVYAIELTKRYSKSQILEWYVNQISYGGVYNGVEAASAGLLRQARERPHAGRGSAARRHPAVARRVRPGEPPRSRDRSAATRCSTSWQRTRPHPDRRRHVTSRSTQERRIAARSSRSKSRSSASRSRRRTSCSVHRAAARGAVRQRRALHRRPRRHHHARPRPAERGAATSSKAGSRSSRAQSDSHNGAATRHGPQDGRDAGHGRQP